MDHIEYLENAGYTAYIEDGVLKVQHHNCFFDDVIVGNVDEIDQERLDDFINTTGIIPTIFC